MLKDLNKGLRYGYDSTDLNPQITRTHFFATKIYQHPLNLPTQHQSKNAV